MDDVSGKECPVCYEPFTYKSKGRKRLLRAIHNYCCGKLICSSCWDAIIAASTTGQAVSCPYCRAPRPTTVEELRVLLLGHAEKGNKAWAQYHLGVNYHHGELRFPKSCELAAHWFTLAANQGNLDAQFNLGHMYYTGQGLPQSYEKAFELYTSASEGGHPGATTKLGMMYYTGEGLPQSYEKAVELFTSAAEEGAREASYSLGLMYLNGEGLPQSYEKAVELFTLAANQGHEGAIAMLPSILLTLVEEGRTDLRCEALYRTKIAVKLPPSEIPEKVRAWYLQYIEEAKITCGRCVRVKKEGKGDLSLCNGCQCIYYCNRECQKAHWKEHKQTCQRISSS
jgi:TPR repeat protein